LTELHLARLVNARPAAILPMQPTGVNRWVLAPLLRVVPALGISSVDLGRAMLRVGLDKTWHGSRTLENGDLKALCAIAASRSNKGRTY
jgi:hypothetical protein